MMIIWWYRVSFDIFWYLSRSRFER